MTSWSYLRTAITLLGKQFADRILPKLRPANCPFVILCAPRTGSTLLHTYLNSHPRIRSLGEVLRESVAEKGRAEADFLNQTIFRLRPAWFTAVGIKVFYEYETDERFSRVMEEIIRDKRVKIIHLVRRDLTRLYVSGQLAHQTGQWTHNAPVGDNGKISLDIRAMRAFSAQYRVQVGRMERLFADHPKLLVAYEELDAVPDQVLRAVQHFLDVRPMQLVSLLKKQHPNPVSSYIFNYEEVKEAMEKTENGLFDLTDSDGMPCECPMPG